jgi:CheY-like chemotaxis protein
MITIERPDCMASSAGSIDATGSDLGHDRATVVDARGLKSVVQIGPGCRTGARASPCMPRTNGRDGLAAVRSFASDVVLLYLGLPDIPGGEVCRRIRDDQAMRQAAIVIVTAKGDEVDRVRGFELGADD